MTIYRYVARSSVAKIEERFDMEYKGGAGDTAVRNKVSLGWWVVTAGPSPIAMQAGPEKPPFKVGAQLDIILEVKS